MEDKKTIPDQTKENEKRFLSTLAKWAFSIAMVLAIVFLATTPLRSHGADNYISKGDGYLKQKKYLSADLAYQKALVLNSNNSTAKERRGLVAKAQLDVNALNDFYNKTGAETEKNTFAEATTFPSSDTEALKTTKKLIEEGEYQLAIIPAEIATQMAPDYGLCWQYLSIANQKVAELQEIAPQAREKYAAAAKEALAKAKEVNPELK